MIQRTRLLSEIRSDFRFIKGKQRSSDTYRQRGGTVFVAIPRNVMIPEDVAKRILRRAGRTEQQIDAFIASCRQEES